MEQLLRPGFQEFGPKRSEQVLVDLVVLGCWNVQLYVDRDRRQGDASAKRGRARARQLRAQAILVAEEDKIGAGRHGWPSVFPPGPGRGSLGCRRRRSRSRRPRAAPGGSCQDQCGPRGSRDTGRDAGGPWRPEPRPRTAAETGGVVAWHAVAACRPCRSGEPAEGRGGSPRELDRILAARRYFPAFRRGAGVGRSSVRCPCPSPEPEPPNYFQHHHPDVRA